MNSQEGIKEHISTYVFVERWDPHGRGATQPTKQVARSSARLINNVVNERLTEMNKLLRSVAVIGSAPVIFVLSGCAGDGNAPLVGSIADMTPVMLLAAN
jgi:hypothetical protein